MYLALIDDSKANLLLNVVYAFILYILFEIIEVSSMPSNAGMFPAGECSSLTLSKKIGPQTGGQFAALFFSTRFDTNQQKVSPTPFCRGPPLLKSGQNFRRTGGHRMGFHYANEKKKFDHEWKRLRKEYADAGMSPSAIEAIHW